MKSVNIATMSVLSILVTVATAASRYNRMELRKFGIDVGPHIDGREDEDGFKHSRVKPISGESIVSVMSSVRRPTYRRKSRTHHHSILSNTVTCLEVTESPKYCPYMSGYEASVKSSNFGDGTISPWVLRDDFDVDRHPEHFAQACCACIHCVNVTGPSPTRLTDHYSVPVTATTTVSKMINGEKRRVSMEIFAGCTCQYRPR